MDKYRNQIIKSGLEIEEEKIYDFIDCARHVSDKIGCDMEVAISMIISFAMFKKYGG